MVAIRVFAALAGIAGCLAHLSGHPTAASASVGHPMYQFPKWQNCSCTSPGVDKPHVVTETKTVLLNYTTECAPPSTVYLPMVLTEARQQTIEQVVTSYVTPSIDNGAYPFAVVAGTTTWLRGTPPANAAVVWDTPSTITVEPTVVTNVAAVVDTPTNSSDETSVITSTSYNFITVALASSPTESAPGAATSSIDCVDADVTCTLTVTKTRRKGFPTASAQDSNVSSQAPPASEQGSGVPSPDSTTTVLRTLIDTETCTITMTRRRSKALTGDETVLATTLSVPSATPTILVNAESSSAVSLGSEGTATLPGDFNSSAPLASPIGNGTAQLSSIQGSSSNATSEIASAETTGIGTAPSNTTASPLATSTPAPSTRVFYPNTTSAVLATQSEAESATPAAALAASPASSSAFLEIPLPPSNIQSTVYPTSKHYGTAPVPSASASTTPDSGTISGPLPKSFANPPSVLPVRDNTTSTVTVFSVTATDTLTTYETHPVSVYVMRVGKSSSSSPVLLITESPPVPGFGMFDSAAETATSAAPSTLETAVRRARLLL